MAHPDRPFDIVLLGATGFTGRLTAEYLARHAPSDLRWAIAGRDVAALESVRAGLGDQHADLAVRSADVTDPASLRELAEATRVVATTVGPYIHLGEPLVAACAEAGTDYVDLTGEPEFVDLMYLRHHARAVETGARLVHCCGFDSVPHDLGALFTVAALPDDEPLRLRGYVRASGAFSAGTYSSAITAFGRVRQTAAARKERRRVEPRPDGRRARAVAGRVGREPDVGAWAVPLPTIDPLVIARSAAALPAYGPDFSYSHYAAVTRLPVAVAGVAGITAVFAAAQLPPARRLLLSRAKAGSGPSPAQRARSWFRVRFVGEAPSGARAVTEVSGGDPGYDETAKMLAESALCLALDEVPETAGQVTTAVAMGDALTRRLRAAGIRFERISDG